jgi:hypothetical protein
MEPGSFRGIFGRGTPAGWLLPTLRAFPEMMLLGEGSSAEQVSR